MGTTWSYLNLTVLGRPEAWEDSPEGYPQPRRTGGGTGTTTTTPRPLPMHCGSISSPTLQEPPSEGTRQRSKHVNEEEHDVATKNLCSKGEDCDSLQ
jgi:hypothetical protein